MSAAVEHHCSRLQPSSAPPSLSLQQQPSTTASSSHSCHRCLSPSSSRRPASCDRLHFRASLSLDRTPEPEHYLCPKPATTNLIIIKAKDLKKGKAPDLTKPKTPDPNTIDLTKDLDNTNWIDEYFDKLPKLNEEIGETGEKKEKKEVGLLPGDLKELDMHSFDFNLLSCLHFAKPELPTGLRDKIFQATSNVRKWWRKQEQLPPFCGLSKSAAKRRAKRYGRCRKCGNWSHDGKCNKNKNDSQNEYTHLIEVGAVRLRAERTIRKGSNVYYAIRNELNLKRDLGLGNLNINEPSD
ncbi:hypothetical protein L1987_65530 [Smallanthus sonchifolius]|uniref:Uncharacterized protein n=1 Tax=Smallanthus sonchifolius TaxID=185202 RepID=A0ACB9BUY4_9ASTR|nr:hypothetical protein L1987_65530 [Smallanthus sonchifolius]